MALTIEEADQYLRSMNVVLPSVMLRLLFGRLSSLELCMNGAGYDQDTQDLIKLYVISMLGALSVDGQISSQSAPSGASRSFRYGALSDRYKSILNQLRILDPSGCSTGLLPSNPVEANCALFISPGDDCDVEYS